MKPIWTALAAALMAGLGLVVPYGAADRSLGFAVAGLPGTLLTALVLLLAATGRVPAVALLIPSGLAGALLALLRLEGGGGPGYWLLFWGFLLASLAATGRISLVEADPNEGALLQRLRGAIPASSVPLVLLLVWQGLVVGFEVPKGIFPGVHHVVKVLTQSYPVLLNDSYVTFVKEVLLGFGVGLLGGSLVGVAVAYSTLLQRGFLPLAAAFGAVPIVGLAPVLGRAFGVDWESKAAVVVIVTFFPVVLNTVQGLVLVEPLKLELLQAYGTKPWGIFRKLRLPNALPFLFNALKLAVVLSVISVIVAEFLIPGPPEGLGQRISLSARRGAYDVVFAAIFLSSAISISIYGLLSLLERRLTGWHSSFREERA